MKYLKIIIISIGIIILTYVVSYAIRFFNSNILQIHSSLNEKEIIVETIIRDLIIIAICFFLLILYNKKNILKTIKIDRFFKGKNIKLIFMMILSGMFLGVILSGIAGNIIPKNKVMFNIVVNSEHSVLGIIFSIIIAPILEEIIFRGVIFNCLKKYCRIPVAIIIQAILFAVFHGNFFQGIYAFIMGIVLAIIYLYTDSLWGDIISHGFANLLSLVLSFKLTAIALPIIGVFSIITLIKNREKYKNILKGNDMSKKEVVNSERD